MVDLIPEFDLGVRTSLTVSMWIMTVEQVVKSYQCSGDIALLQAVSKLRGAARTYYDTFGIEVNNGENFQRAVTKTFLSALDKADVLQRLKQRRKNKSESHEEYFYKILTIGKRGVLDKVHYQGCGR